MEMPREGATLLGQIGSGLQSQQQDPQGQQEQLEYHEGVQQLADSNIAKLSEEIESVKHSIPNQIAEATGKVAEALLQELVEAR